MALTKVGEHALTVAKQEKAQIVVNKPTKKVLDEETYTQEVEKIIERDFYPDLPKMKAQQEYLEALAKNDTEKLREIHIKYGPKRGTTKTPSIYDTPATFETPDNRQKSPSRSQTEEEKKKEEEMTRNPEMPQSKEKKDVEMGLDKYLAKNTSEDNMSFSDIIKENEKKHRLKHAWLYDKEEEQKQEKADILALPSAEQQLAIEANPENRLQGWNYEAKNSLMYVPDGVAESTKEKVFKKPKPREIKHKNTRFQTNPFNLAKSQQTIHQAASFQAMAQHGKIGVDGKEIQPTESPKVNGYGFMATPSPAPGVDESPLMTWGEIEGTPFRLDGSDTPVSSTKGPSFRIPDIPKRDQIAFDLAEKASKAHRDKKERALKRVTANFSTPTPKFGSASSSERLSSMSPAAQRLASTKLGVRTHTDKALRASYTPSPLHRLPGDKTPVMLTSRRTPKLGESSKRGGVTPKTTPTPKRDSSTASLTDNLLNLPKRARAVDFF